jgi:hypothetical protein
MQINFSLKHIKDEDIQELDVYSQVVLQNFQLALSYLNSEKEKILQKNSES